MVYDNINFIKRVKAKTSTDQDEMQNAVVSNLVLLDHRTALPSEEHPTLADELFRQVWGDGVSRPTITPEKICPDGMSSLLRIPAARTPCLADVNPDDYLPTDEMNQHMQENMAIHLVHGLIDFDPNLEPLRSKVPSSTAIYPLASEKSVLRPLPMQDVDESKIDSQSDLLQKLLQQYLGLTNGDFKDMVLPIFGDCFTVNRLRLATEQMLEDTTDAYSDKMAFTEPHHGPFHLLVSLSRFSPVACGSHLHSCRWRWFRASSWQMQAPRVSKTPFLSSIPESCWSSRR